MWELRRHIACIYYVKAASNLVRWNHSSVATTKHRTARVASLLCVFLEMPIHSSLELNFWQNRQLPAVYTMTLPDASWRMDSCEWKVNDTRMVCSWLSTRPKVPVAPGSMKQWATCEWVLSQWHMDGVWVWQECTGITLTRPQIEQSRWQLFLLLLFDW